MTITQRIKDHLLLYAVVGSFGLFLASCVLQQAKTPEQAYYGAKSDYLTVLTGVDVYITSCRQHVTVSCKAKSEKMQAVDKKIFGFFIKADEALIANDSAALTKYIALISAAIEELKSLKGTVS